MTSFRTLPVRCPVTRCLRAAGATILQTKAAFLPQFGMDETAKFCYNLARNQHFHSSY
jgi:hypothetical protein